MEERDKHLTGKGRGKLPVMLLAGCCQTSSLSRRKLHCNSLALTPRIQPSMCGRKGSRARHPCSDPATANKAKL